MIIDSEVPTDIMLILIVVVGRIQELLSITLTDVDRFTAASIK